MKQVLYILLGALLISGVQAQDKAAPAQVKKANPLFSSKGLKVDKWISIPEGKEAPTAENLKGKVVYVAFFQGHCGGCHSVGLPALQELHKKYKDDKGVQLIAVNLQFMNIEKDGPEAAKATLKKLGLTNVTLGHCGKETAMKLITNLQAKGTPWVVMFNKHGVVKFSAAHIETKNSEKVINILKARK